MKNIAFIIYRGWAYKIFSNILKKNINDKIILITNKNAEFETKKLKIKNFVINANDNKKIYEILKNNQIDIVFIYGWSWIIGNKIINKFLCICLHPSKLPLFRGGSPIQNQILRGINKSAVSIFKMNKYIDRGDIFMQKKLSLKGNMKKILSEISNIGFKITLKLLEKFKKNKLKFFKQRGKNSYFKRRNSKDNIISVEGLKKISYSELSDYVRCLQDPYPGFKVFLKNKTIKIIKIKKYKKTIGLNLLKKEKNKYLELKDSCVKVIKSKTIKFIA